MTLKSSTLRPPTGWVYVQPDTGWEARHPTRQMLIDSVVLHRKSNNLDRASASEVWEDIQNHICNALRGQPALWRFCNTRFPMPGSGPAQQIQMIGKLPRSQSSITPVVTTQSVQAIKPVPETKKASCPTCGLKKRKK